MKQFDQKPTPWVVKHPVTTEGTFRESRPRSRGQKQMEIYRDLAMALIGSRLEMRKAA
jgi:hypothetical protein